MNFLAKLLQVIALIPSVINGIEGIFGNRTGTDKKNAAMSFVKAALSSSEAVAQKEVADPAKFQEGLEKIIDGRVGCLNASVWAKKQAAS